jgi:hypothetical protein
VAVLSVGSMKMGGFIMASLVAVRCHGLHDQRASPAITYSVTDSCGIGIGLFSLAW